jgi:hypothetical protein
MQLPGTAAWVSASQFHATAFPLRLRPDELNGDDLRPDPLDRRKATLEMILAKAGPGIRFNGHMEGDGQTVFRHACKLGLEGIVSKRKDSAYCSDHSPDWLKMKNADAPAVKREAEEDWVKRNGDGRSRPGGRTRRHPRDRWV